MRNLKAAFLVLAAALPACVSTAPNSATAEQAQSHIADGQPEIECDGVFEKLSPAAVKPFPADKIYWRGWPHRAYEVEGPLDLDQDGVNERVFIGMYVPGGGMTKHIYNRLVIITERSPLFENIDPDGLKVIFNKQMTQMTPEDTIPNVKRLMFANFLSNIALAPGGKPRNEGWSGYEYTQYFDQFNVFVDPQETLPPLSETRVSVVSVDRKSYLLLEATTSLTRPANRTITNYRFLARYLGGFTLQVLCGEFVE